MAMGGIPGIAPGHTAFGQSCFHAGAPSATSGVLISLASLMGILYPLLRKAIPNAFSFGITTWQVMHDVSKRRAKIGSADPVSVRVRMVAIQRIIRNTKRIRYPYLQPVYPTFSRGFGDSTIGPKKQRPSNQPRIARITRIESA